ncbi:hypothetical protein SLS63_004608 [Diaporthe eres]|uniref:Ankyrin repeat protein n=1 Tax=Diaporthe eres TaxID=83184 RepID=A0ABR1PDE7_DIAER
MPDLDGTAALTQWANENKEDYESHVASPEFSMLYGMGFQFASSTQVSGKNFDSFDDGLVAGFNVFYGTFQLSTKESFIQLVRQHGIVEKPSGCGLTMLQIAAAKGDMELAKTLVVDLGAEVDAVGVSKTTPLWVSCFMGHIDMTLYLFGGGANLRCKDGKHGRTILHCLNRCRSPESLVTLAELSLSAGLSVDERDLSGRTPLMSTFVGWDFSRGLAARWLIRKQADVLVRSDDEWSSLAAAARRFDLDMMNTILDAACTSLLTDQAEARAPDLSIGDAKVHAFATILSQAEFHARRFHGHSTITKLGEIVHLLIDADMMDRWRSLEIWEGTNPLIAACLAGRDELALAVLRAKHRPDINQTCQGHGKSALHWAVEHGRTTVAMELLLKGADPLIKDKDGANVIHRSGMFSPELLVDFIDRMETGELPEITGQGISHILSLPNSKGENVFFLLVIEGTSKHLEAAELLRTRYNLEHDSLSFNPHGEVGQMTLTAYMIYCAVSSNLFTLNQIEYLLTLEPLPAFVADTSGATLLHYAVRNWQYVIRIEENNEHLPDALKLRIAKTYQRMRNMGACLPSELEPIMVAYVSSGLSRFVQISDAL